MAALMALSAQGLAQSINTSDTLTEHSLIATFYHDRFEGRKTSCGEIFDQNLFTAAHKSLKIGTMLMVTNPTTAAPNAASSTSHDAPPMPSASKADSASACAYCPTATRSNGSHKTASSTP